MHIFWLCFEVITLHWGFEKLIVGARVYLISNKYIYSLSPDPIGYGDGLNMFAYVGNVPMNYTDPMEMCKSKGRLGLFVLAICLFSGDVSSE